MTKRQFVVIVFRLFALLLVFQLISNLAYFFSLFNSPLEGPSFTMLLMSVFAICITLFFISLIWRKSEWLMEKVFAIPVLSDHAVLPNNVEANNAEEIADDVTDESIETDSILVQDYYETPLSIEGIQLVAISIAGLWSALSHISYLTQRLSLILTSRYTVSTMWWSAVSDVITVGLGAWLFLRPWQFQEWIERLKPKLIETEDVEQTSNS